MAVLILLSIIVLLKRINVLNAGEKESVSLGENPVRTMVVCFLMISLATAATYAMQGP